MAEMPKEGFLKVTAPERPDVDPERKAALIRKGNQLFNSGDVDTAGKIFVTLGYTDGIIRTGDYHYKNGEYWEAYKLYFLAPAPAKTAYMIERMAGIVREWIHQS